MGWDELALAHAKELPPSPGLMIFLFIGTLDFAFKLCLLFLVCDLLLERKLCDEKHLDLSGSFAALLPVPRTMPGA